MLLSRTTTSGVRPLVPKKVPERFERRDGNRERQGVDINGAEETERGGEG